MIRFSLTTLLFLVVLAALCVSALKYASELTLEITETVLFCVLIACTLLAVHGRGTLRRFSSGFALTGWGFLVALFLFMFIGGNEPWRRSAMVTERLSRMLYQSMHDVAPPKHLTFEERLAMGKQVAPDAPEGVPDFAVFLRVCHALTGLTLAFCGGVFACASQMRHRETTDE